MVHDRADPAASRVRGDPGGRLLVAGGQLGRDDPGGDLSVDDEERLVLRVGVQWGAAPRGMTASNNPSRPSVWAPSSFTRM